MNSGIYMIKNLYTGLFYIGSAVNFKKRWDKHKFQLNNNIHHSKYLQRAWNKYGSNSFDFIVIEYCDSPNLINNEQYWINYLLPKYNICKIAGTGCRLGILHSEISKKKMSISKVGNKNRLGKYHTEETKRKCSLSNIGNIHTEETKSKISKYQKGKIRSYETRKKMSDSKKDTSTFLQYDLYGNFLREVKSSDVKYFNTHLSNVIKCAKGERNKSGGFIWKYK